MTTQLTLLEGGADTSPFDAIRRVRPDGAEYWSARDLMPLMAYAQWQNFMVPMNRAMTTATNQGMTTETLFMRSHEKTGGRPREDFQLSRYAAYLVAMNGDPNIPEVAAAQHYFAVRTREAETAPQRFEVPTTYAGALRAAAEQAERAELEAARAAEAERVIAAQAPAVAKAAAHSGVDEWKTRMDFAREVQQWGDEQGLDIKQKAVLALLSRKGMTIGPGRSDSGQIKREAVRACWGRNHKGVTEDTGHAYTTPQLSPRGQDLAWKWITDAVAEYGAGLNPKTKD